MQGKKRVVCVVITARPSYSRIKTVLTAISNHDLLDLKLVVAGPALLSKYGNVSKFIERDGFKIDYKVSTMLEGESLLTSAKSVGLGVVELSAVFSELKPDVVVTVADRFETMSTAIASSFQNIPLAHIQGGEVTGSIDEKVRHSITKLSDIHLVSSQDAFDRVYNLGESEETIFNTGCPSIDIAKDVLEDSQLDFNPFKKYGGVGEIFDYNKYLVVLQHPVTTEHGESFFQAEQTLSAIKSLDIPTFWFWPNIDAGSDGTSNAIRSFRENNNLDKIHFFKNMVPNDFLKLLINSMCIVGNSSVAIRECSYLGVPAVNIGSRQEGRIRGSNVIDVNYDTQEIFDAINTQLMSDFKSDSIFGDGNSGIKIAEVLASVELKFDKKIRY